MELSKTIIENSNIKITKTYYCPHHPEFSSKNICNCRKPSPQMVFNAAKDFSIDLSNSYFIGDKISDIECAVNAGVKSILLTNTINRVELNELKKSQNSPNFIAENFLNAVKFIENNLNGDFVEN